MVNKKRNLNSKERDMISSVGKVGGFQTANEISRESNKLKKKTTKSQTKRYGVNPKFLK